MTRPCVHFVGFRTEREYLAAVRVWGVPDFIHQWWDRRAAREIGPADTVVFTQTADQTINQFNSPDPDGGLRLAKGYP